MKSLGGTLWHADLLTPLGEGRCCEGRTGQEHLTGHRGTDPGIQGKTRRDNVGKGHLPAGTGDNLQRPGRIRREPKTAGRDLVWRMSPYERRRSGNALRGGARRHPAAGNTHCRLRGSGHSVVPRHRSDTVLRYRSSPKQGRTRGQTTVERGVCAPALKPPRTWEGPRAESRGQNRTREIRPSGIVGGPGETWAKEGLGTRSATERADDGNYPPKVARAPALSRLPGGADNRDVGRSEHEENRSSPRE